MLNDFRLHVLAIGLQDRPGAVHSVAEVFSGRGLQMEAFHGTADSLNPDGHAQALILFHATADRAELVTRVLRRLSSVRCAELLAADDPRLLQSVLVARDQAGAVAPTSAPEGIGLLPVDAHSAMAVGLPSAMQAWLSSDGAPRRLSAVRMDLVSR